MYDKCMTKKEKQKARSFRMSDRTFEELKKKKRRGESWDLYFHNLSKINYGNNN